MSALVPSSSETADAAMQVVGLSIIAVCFHGIICDTHTPFSLWESKVRGSNEPSKPFARGNKTWQ
jgi:hypothetical protein